MLNEKLEKLKHEKYVIEKKLTVTKYKEKQLQSQLKRLNRSERTYHLCTRAGMLETFLKEPNVLTDDDVMELLTFIFHDKQYEQRYILIAFLPIIFFWFLDSYYLYLEKKYKKLYDDVRKKEEKDIDFDMSTTSFKVCYCECLFNISESLFYIPFIILIFILMKLLKVI